MNIQHIMERDVITLHENTSYEDAVRTLHDHQISGCPVVDAKDQLVGIVTQLDLLRILFPYYDSYYRTPEAYANPEDRESKATEIRLHAVSTFMSRQVITATPDMPMIHAAGIMLAHHIQHLPVLEGDRLVGFVTRQQILREIFKKNFNLN